MRGLAGLLAQETDRLGAELAAFVLEEVPAYRDLDSDEIRAVAVTSGRVNVGPIRSMLQFGIPPQTIRQFAHIITLRDGRWLHFRDFANSAEAAEVFADA